MCLHLSFVFFFHSVAVQSIYVNSVLLIHCLDHTDLHHLNTLFKTGYLVKAFLRGKGTSHSPSPVVQLDVQKVVCSPPPSHLKVQLCLKRNMLRALLMDHRVKSVT